MSTRHELLVDETVNTPRGTLQVKRVFTYSQNLPCDTGNQDEVFITELDSNNQPNGLKVSFKDSRGYRAPDKARFLCDVLPVTNGVLNGVGYRFSSDGGLRAINVWKNDEII
ncbi:MAG: hypothetical protein ILP11_00030, partial [Alphaproteobacteria bacterium]|nr:hypothetical protein [Alphaproteobacteria bacterium]